METESAEIQDRLKHIQEVKQTRENRLLFLKENETDYLGILEIYITEESVRKNKTSRMQEHFLKEMSKARSMIKNQDRGFGDWMTFLNEFRKNRIESLQIEIENYRRQIDLLLEQL